MKGSIPHISYQRLALKARIGEIDEFLESLFVSLDGIGSLHDKLRGANGSFAHALEGIKAAKRHGLSVAISSTITRDNTFTKLNKWSHLQKI
jgi:MoaA/NifB/PqqE/SkfB family radical SAM enzyme